MRIKKELYILFVPTLVFLILFAGLYLLISMKFTLNNDYEIFSFRGGTPSNTEILLMGFRNLKESFYFILLTTIFTIIGVSILKNKMLKYGGKNKTVLNSLVLTFLLAFLYMAYKLLYSIGFDKEHFRIYWSEIKGETFTLFILYLFISFPVTILSTKQIAKS